MSYKALTKRGYDLFEVSSAFQKAIRRGKETLALYWGYELYLSGYHGYAWKSDINNSFRRYRTSRKRFSFENSIIV